LDFAVVVVSAVEGVRAHTENILRALDEYKMPRMVFVNKIDRAGADVERVLGELEKLPTKGKANVYMPVCRVMNCGEPNGSIRVFREDELAGAGTEALCELYEEAEEAFLNDETLPFARIGELMKEAIAEGNLTPVLAGSAKYGVGI
jgi:ribosomal protection tetracycline resistance protein